MRVQKRRMIAGVLALILAFALLLPQETAYAANTGLPQGDPIVIVLDPGHGGGDSGATRVWGGKTYREKTMNLVIAKACKAKLEEYTGVKVYLTRTSDYYVGLEARVGYAKQKGADLFVSIHNNASYRTSDRGACVFYPNASYKSVIGKNGRKAAQCIQRKLVACGLKNNGISYRNTENKSRYPDKSLADYYSVIRNSKASGFTGVIVEHAYISNPGDCKQFLGSTAKLKKLGEADAAGIVEYFGLVKMDAPELTGAESDDDCNVTLRWEVSEDVDGYVLFRKKAGEKYTQAAWIEGGDESEYIDTSLEPGTEYKYTLCAYREGKIQYIYTSAVLELSVTTPVQEPTEPQEPAESTETAEAQEQIELQELVGGQELAGGQEQIELQELTEVQ